MYLCVCECDVTICIYTAQVHAAPLIRAAHFYLRSSCRLVDEKSHLSDLVPANAKLRFDRTKHVVNSAKYI